MSVCFFFQAEDGIRDSSVTGVQTCALPISCGLNGPKTRQQLDPQAREAYLEMLKGADVSRIDRGETKSVRLVFDITPRFLEAAKSAAHVVAPQTPETKVRPTQTRRPSSRKQKSTN